MHKQCIIHYKHEVNFVHWNTLTMSYNIEIFCLTMIIQTRAKLVAKATTGLPFE